MTSTIAPPMPAQAPDVVRIDGMTEARWNEFLDGFEDASLYQTWAYGAVSWGERQLSHLALLRDGRPIALAQFRIVRLPVVRRGVAYLRWGPVCTPRGESWDPSRYRAVARAIVAEYAQRRRLLVRILPALPVGDERWSAAGQIWSELGFRPDSGVRPYHSLRLDLSPPLDVLRRQLDQKWRNQLNGAERNALTVREGTGRDLYDTFLRLYHEMMARKNFDTTVDPDEFGRIQERLPESQKMLVFISEKDGQPMTGLVASRVGESGIYLLGATSDAGMKSKGSYLLQWRMIERLKALGCRGYDLGGIDPEKNPGVYHFKQGMGGDEIRFPGRFSFSADPFSTFCVSLAERLQSLMARARRPRPIP
ncbi:MAG: peptidoglycan bridge formation glycyltransferase FemA/FemB family protein [Verrucomicrobiae bacterium]|nr:peptidoglycan bridge formation glycyltransferase FemA/FemB family protein [Verrucomicrobiae bacterium]